MALGLIAAPVITRTTEDVLRLQPTALREASVALGAPVWRTILAVIWKSAQGGMLTGALLAFARISGETAPLLFTALNNQFLSLDMTKPTANLPVVIFNYRAQRLRRLAPSRLGRRPADRRNRADGDDPRPPARPGAPPLMNAQIDTQPETAVLDLPSETVKLAIRDLNFFYGPKQALFDVNVSFAANAVTALIGPSGCGKSTLLRTLNRMYSLYPGQRATGQVLLDGEDILGPRVNVAALRARIGMVFQKPTPFPMSIFDNVAYGVRLYEKMSKPDLANRVEESLRRAALWDEVKDKLKESGLGLSGGQQQRLCVARGIAVKPEILLLDEPASALDPISTARLEETIAALKSEYTVVIVTHNMGQAARLSDHTGFMYLGKLVEFGETEQLFTNPVTARARDYITGRFG